MNFCILGCYILALKEIHITQNCIEWSGVVFVRNIAFLNE